VCSASTELQLRSPIAESECRTWRIASTLSACAKGHRARRHAAPPERRDEGGASHQAVVSLLGYIPETRSRLFWAFICPINQDLKHLASHAIPSVRLPPEKNIRRNDFALAGPRCAENEKRGPRPRFAKKTGLLSPAGSYPMPSRSRRETHSPRFAHEPARP